MQKIIVFKRFWLASHLALVLALLATHCAPTESCPVGTACLGTESVICPPGSEPGSACDDHSLCTTGDHCDENRNCVGTPVSCTGTDLCMDYGCDPAMGCTQAPRRCADDGNTCTVEACVPGRGCVSTVKKEWCRRNCDVVEVNCGTPCNAGGGSPLVRYCADYDADGYYNAGVCGEYCTALERPPGAPEPLRTAPPDRYIRADNARADCDDSAAHIHPGAAELCTPIDENCDGNPYDGMPSPGQSQSCTRCGFAGTQTADAACHWSACAIPPSNDFGPLPAQTDPLWGHEIPQCLWCFGRPCASDSSAWCSTGGYDQVVYGPYIALPAGNYVVHFQGSHRNSVTVMDVRDATSDVVLPGTQHAEGAGTLTVRFDWNTSFSAEECHQYEFRIYAEQYVFWEGFYDIRVERIFLTRQ